MVFEPQWPVDHKFPILKCENCPTQKTRGNYTVAFGGRKLCSSSFFFLETQGAPGTPAGAQAPQKEPQDTQGPPGTPGTQPVPLVPRLVLVIALGIK